MNPPLFLMLNLNFYTLNKKTMTQSTYNGWTNYATWRVRLEFFDGFEYGEVYGYSTETHELANYLKELVENHLEYECRHERNYITNSFVLSYALAFLDDVNWYEIAECMITEYKCNN